jgi:iron complex outermembrane receptor protein
VYVRNSQSSAKAQNVSSAEIRGDEVSLRVDLPRGLSASGAYTWQSAVDRGSNPAWQGKNVPQRPARQLYARLDAGLGGFRLASDVQHTGDTYLDRYNRYVVKSRTLVGASIGYAILGGALSLTLEGKNLGNAQAADVSGYPLPGRSFFAALAWHTAAPDLH